MATFETVALIIAVLVATGRFFDSQHLEGSTKEAIKNGLIRFYFFLYSLPKRLPSFLSRIVDIVSPIPDYDVRTGKPRHTERVWLWRLYYFFGMPLITFGFAYIYSDSSQDQFGGWGWGIIFGLLLALSWFYLVIALFGVMVLFAFIPGLIICGIVEGIRRFMLVVLNKSTSPTTSPFAYFTGLLAVLTALIGLVKHLVT
jgi:hypothetical protein